MDITYDWNDNQTSVRDANGNLAQFAYNDMDLLTGVTDALSGGAAYGYDPATLTGPGGQSVFTHDPGGRLTRVQNPGGRTRSFTYDAASRVTQVQNQTASGTQTFA